MGINFRKGKKKKKILLLPKFKLRYDYADMQAKTEKQHVKCKR